MKFTQIPSTTFKKLQMNAGILVDSFTPATGTIGNIIGATTGGVKFNDTPSFKDFGEDIDNCPKNMMELKKLDSREIKMAGTFLTVDADVIKGLIGLADVDSNDQTHIVPRDDIELTDFTDLWWIGDYSDVNTGDNAGFLAIHLMRALNTAGFSIQSTDKEKSQFAFEYLGHYTMDDQDEVPYEIYVKSGEATVQPSVNLNTHAATITVGDSYTLTATTVPAGKTVTWTTSNNTKADVSNGIVSGEGAGSAIITATITVDGVDYTDTCTIIVEAAPSP